MKATLMKTTIFFLTTINALIFCGYSDTGSAADKVVVIPLHSKGASNTSGWTDDGGTVFLTDTDASVEIGKNSGGAPGSKLRIESNKQFGVYVSAPENSLYAFSENDFAIYGYANNKGVYGYAWFDSGVYGQAERNGVYGSANFFGVYGNANNYGVKGSAGNYGVYGYGELLYGVYGNAQYNGVVGYAQSAYGVYGNSNYYGVYGSADHYGVYGNSNYYGVYGNVSDAYGVYGNSANWYGVYGYAANDYGGYFEAGSGNAIYSNGNILISNGCGIKYYSNSNLKAFTIDHPLDPENKVLRHFSTEGPEALVIYRGKVVLDENGEAEVLLPDYFAELSRESHVQLTSIGTAVALGLKEEFNGNTFTVIGPPNAKLMWQVTAERDDPKARLERVARPVEEAKGNPGLPMPGEYISQDAYGR